jgi:hypothetical protein
MLSVNLVLLLNLKSVWKVSKVSARMSNLVRINKKISNLKNLKMPSEMSKDKLIKYLMGHNMAGYKNLKAPLANQEVILYSYKTLRLEPIIRI